MVELSWDNNSPPQLPYYTFKWQNSNNSPPSINSPCQGRVEKIIGTLWICHPPPILSLRVFLKRRKWSEIIFFSMSIIFFFFKYFACLFCLFTYSVLTFHSFRLYIYHISLILLDERKMIDMEKKIISEHFLRLRKTLRLKIGGGVTYP